MKSYSFRTVIEKDGTKYHGFVPALPGCHTFGSTIEDTKKRLNEAIEAYLISCAKNGDPIPSDEGLQSIETVSIPTPVFRSKKAYA